MYLPTQAAAFNGGLQVAFKIRSDSVKAKFCTAPKARKQWGLLRIKP